MVDDPGIIQNLVKFEFAELPEDGIALVLAYATSQEALSRNEMQSFVIGMTRPMARALAGELKRFADSPSGTRARQARH